LLAGCNWESSAEAFVNGVVAGGVGVLPLPIPANAAFEGIPLWCQALIVGPSGQQLTNGLAIGLGK